MDFIRIFIHPFVSLRIVDGISHNTMNLADFVRRSISSSSRNDRYTLERESKHSPYKTSQHEFYLHFVLNGIVIITLTFLLFVFTACVCTYVCM